MKKQLWICLLAILTYKTTSGCPLPCFCTTDSKGSRVSCDMFYDRLGYFPTNFPNDTYYMRLSWNDIKTINVTICDLYPNLEELWLDGNQITYIPADVFADCTNLVTLELSNNDIKPVNGSICNPFSKLETLELSGSQMSYISAEVFVDCKNLKRLGLSYNGITYIHHNAFINLNNLQILFLHSNDITDINDAWFVNLNNLEYLHLEYNKLTRLSASTFRSISNLKRLVLYNNDITDIHDDALVNLRNLTRLTLYRNRLTSIGASIFRHLTNLDTLDLRYNNIKEMKGGMWKNTNLKYMYLDDNPLLCDCGIWSFYEWAKATSSRVSGAECISRQNVINIQQEYFRPCSYCDCYNGGLCVITETNLTSCQCVGNWTGEKCKENQCSSHSCGHESCYLEGQSGRAVCPSSICQVFNLKISGT